MEVHALLLFLRHLLLRVKRSSFLVYTLWCDLEAADLRWKVLRYASLTEFILSFKALVAHACLVFQHWMAECSCPYDLGEPLRNSFHWFRHSINVCYLFLSQQCRTSLHLALLLARRDRWTCIQSVLIVVALWEIDSPKRYRDFVLQIRPWSFLGWVECHLLEILVGIVHVLPFGTVGFERTEWVICG